MIHSVKLFWWAGDRSNFSNFGDAIAPIILKRIAGIEPEWASAARSEIVVTGSVLTMLPDGWRGLVVGAGYAHSVGQYADAPHPLEYADFRAVRGRFSMAQLPYMSIQSAPLTGDPGLLASMLIEPQQKKYSMGIVPHYQDRSMRQMKGHHIDVTGDPLEVIREIARCEKVIASSLHGIIVADAFGIERKWHRFNLVQGGGFKFADYGTTVGMFPPEEWGRADPEKVKALQEGLVYALQGI
jgi:pyruvyltransferase